MAEKNLKTDAEKNNYKVKETRTSWLDRFTGRVIPPLRDSMVYYRKPDNSEYFTEYIEGKPYYEFDVNNGVARAINHDTSTKPDTTYIQWNFNSPFEFNLEELKSLYNNNVQNAHPRYKWLSINPVQEEKDGGKVIKDQKPAGPITEGYFAGYNVKVDPQTGDTTVLRKEPTFTSTTKLRGAGSESYTDYIDSSGRYTQRVQNGQPGINHARKVAKEALSPRTPSKFEKAVNKIINWMGSLEDGGKVLKGEDGIVTKPLSNGYITKLDFDDYVSGKMNPTDFYEKAKINSGSYDDLDKKLQYVYEAMLQTSTPAAKEIASFSPITPIFRSKTKYNYIGNPAIVFGGNAPFKVEKKQATDILNNLTWNQLLQQPIHKQGGKISDLLNNQEFLTTLLKCGGKMKKKACGGKMKKKK